MVAFQQIYESSHLKHEEENRMLRRFVNSFSNVSSNQQSDDIRSENCNSIKRKRLIMNKVIIGVIHSFLFMIDIYSSLYSI